MSTLSDLAPLVYQPWPASVINEAVTEFNDQMHDGAGIPEIAAGLHGLDFLCRRSDIGPDLQARIDGCTIEAKMRIELLAAHEAEQRTQTEQTAMVRASLHNMQRTAEHILHLARTGFYGDLTRARHPFICDDEDDIEA